MNPKQELLWSPGVVDLRGWQVHQSIAELSGPFLPSNAQKHTKLSSGDGALSVSACLVADRHLFVSSVMVLGSCARLTCYC